MTAPTRYCPDCFARNDWDATRCGACGAGLASDDTYDERLVWALDHPDTATAMLAAELLARRHARSSIEPLIRATASPDPYRAAAAARALTAFDDDRARTAIGALRDHPSALVRRAVAGQSLDEGS
jgi:HEAT repeat protein